MATPFDVNQVFTLRDQLKACNDARKELRTKYEPMEEQMIELMFSQGKRFLDKTGRGGPYITLKKKVTPGAFTNERLHDFFAHLLPVIRSGQIQTPDQCTEKVQEYLKQFQTLEITLDEVNKRPTSSMHDLLQFREEVMRDAARRAQQQQQQPH